MIEMVEQTKGNKEIQIKVSIPIFKLAQLLFSAALLIIVLVPVLGMDFWAATLNTLVAIICIGYYMFVKKTSKKQ